MPHLLGYARVSTADQNPDLQLDALRAVECYACSWTPPVARSMTGHN